MNLTRIIKLCNKAVVLLSVLALSFQASAHDQRQHEQNKKMYVRADVGGSILEFGKLAREQYASRFKPALVYAVGIGYEITNKIRTDFTISNRGKYRYEGKEGAASATQSVSNTAFMINGYYNVSEANFTPYVMAGLGAAVNKAQSYNFSNSIGDATYPGRVTTTFAWQAGAGLIYKFNDSIHADLGYRYVSSNLAKTSDVVLYRSGQRGADAPAETRMKSHECTIGLIYRF